MATRGFFHIPLYHSKVIFAHGADIMGIPYNAMGALRLYPIHFNLPANCEIDLRFIKAMFGFFGLIGVIITLTTYIYFI